MDDSDAPDQTYRSSTGDRTLFLGIEAGPGRQSGKAGALRDINVLSIIAGCVPVFILFLTVGPVLVSSLRDAGLSNAEISSWMMGIHVISGLIGLLLATYYRQPIVGAYSIPGIAIVASALASISYPEAIAGFIVSGLIVAVLGVTRVAKKLVRYIPSPIMSAMIAGVLLSFPINMVEGVQSDIGLGAAVVAGYAIVHRWIPRVPAIVGALVAGISAGVLMGSFRFTTIDWGVASPNFVMPEFTVVSIVSVSIPLAIAVLGSENMQAIGVLSSIGFRPPVTAMTLLSGIGGVLAGLFGGHNANIAGPATAACAAPDAGPVRSRYVVAICGGFIVIMFGILAPVVTQVFSFFPESLMAILVGLVLLPIITSAFGSAWRAQRFGLSVIVTFVVAVSDIAPFGISSAFWALLVGCLTALLIETKDFKAYLSADSAVRAATG